MRFISLLTKLRTPCEDTVAHLLNALNIKFTQWHLEKQLTEHPNYPSLASIADIIGISYDVACAPIRIGIAEYKNSADFRLPFLALIQSEGKKSEAFAVVTQLSADNIILYNPILKKNEQLTLPCFDKYYKGLILIVEPGSKKQEDNYEENLRKQKESLFYHTLSVVALPVLAIIISVLYAVKYPIANVIAPILFTLFSLGGSFVTTLLLWHEIDEFNPVVRQICQASAQVNCSAVLHSKASKIKGLSWSSLGFVFFSGVLLSLLVTGISHNSLVLSAWMSAASLPYIFFSIYYQWKVIKQWCVLCLIIQGLLLLLFFTALVGGFLNLSFLSELSAYSIVAHLTSFFFVFIAINVLMPALQKAKSNKQKTIELQRMKHNPQIFEGILAKQKNMGASSEGLGITIGNPNSVFKLVKVCNPYCAPCAKAHPILDELIGGNEEVSLQIIFTTSDDEKDITREPVMHLMAVDSKCDEQLTKKALDDWYLSDKKDYAAFASQYPMNGELQLQRDKLKKMSQWCNDVQIKFTPTFFICLNNHDESPQFYQLPDIYSIADLKYFFAI